MSPFAPPLGPHGTSFAPSPSPQIIPELLFIKLHTSLLGKIFLSLKNISEVNNESLPA